MAGNTLKRKAKEWVRRYAPAEALGLSVALVTAWFVFAHTHSYIAAAAAGIVAQGTSFYGYFITLELVLHTNKYREYPLFRRLFLAVGIAGASLFAEFAPAAILDSLFIRPLALYLVPQLLHPYPLGFLVGVLCADAIFYLVAIVGYEGKKKWLPAVRGPK
jgi:hypothetical protein